MEFSISSIGFRWSPASNSFDVYVDRRMQKTFASCKYIVKLVAIHDGIQIYSCLFVRSLSRDFLPRLFSYILGRPPNSFICSLSAKVRAFYFLVGISSIFAPSVGSTSSEETSTEHLPLFGPRCSASNRNETGHR